MDGEREREREKREKEESHTEYREDGLLGLRKTRWVILLLPLALHPWVGLDNLRWDISTKINLKEVGCVCVDRIQICQRPDGWIQQHHHPSLRMQRKCRLTHVNAPVQSRILEVHFMNAVKEMKETVFLWSFWIVVHDRKDFRNYINRISRTFWETECQWPSTWKYPRCIFGLLCDRFLICTKSCY